MGSQHDFQGVMRGNSSEPDQAAAPDSTADLTCFSEGALPFPVSNQPTSQDVSLQSAESVFASGSSFRPASSEGTVARDRPALLPSSAPESPESSRRSFTRSAIDCTATNIAEAIGVVKVLQLAATRVAGQDPRVRTFADRILWIQNNSGSERLSQADVARRAGLTPQAVTRLVRESKAHPDKRLGQGATMSALARAHNVDVDWLMTGSGAPRRGKLSARDVVLAERAWSEPARAAALAEKRERSAEQWRALLEAIESAVAGPPSSMPPRSSAGR